MLRRVVLKIGGSLGTNDVDALNAAVTDLRLQGDLPIIVHGGGPRISAALLQMGIELPFVDGVRVTTAEAMPIIEHVLCKDVNSEIVMAVESSGARAASVTSRDAVLWAKPLPGLMRTASIASVSTEILDRMLALHEVPVVAPVAVDEFGEPYNVNADIAAAFVAQAVRAERVVFFTDVEGIYLNFDAKELLHFANEGELRAGLSDGRFQGGMIPKVNAVLEALTHGVEAAFVVHGKRVESALWAVNSTPDKWGARDALRTNGLGTCVVSSKVS